MEQEDEFDRKRADFADPPKQISNEGQKKAKALAKQGKNMVKSEEMLSPEQRRYGIMLILKKIMNSRNY